MSNGQNIQIQRIKSVETLTQVGDADEFSSSSVVEWGPLHKSVAQTHCVMADPSISISEWQPT